MSRIAHILGDLKARGEKALVTFVTAGDPDLETTEQIIHVLVEAGADLIELGFPFSDPMADGPTIQASSERALEVGPGRVLQGQMRKIAASVPVDTVGTQEALEALAAG